MILGRPINLWLGFTTAIVGFASVMAVAAGVDPALVANLAGGAGGVLGAGIALVAGQPPTLAPGDTFNIVTPKGQPNYESTVATPPAASKPVPELEPNQ